MLLNPSSQFFRYWALAQAGVIVALVGWRIHLGPLPYTPLLRAHVDMDTGIKIALDVFSNDCGRYPTASEGFQALIICPTNIPLERWRGHDLAQVPKDPWNHDYVYRCPGIHSTNGFDLFSCGYDGISKSGGSDLDDINNWDPHSPHGQVVTFPRMIDEIIQSMPIFLEIMLTLLTIPFLFAVRLIASFSSPRVRDEIARNPTVHSRWFFVSLAVILIFLMSLKLSSFVVR